jgi:hypothetical protein
MEDFKQELKTSTGLITATERFDTFNQLIAFDVYSPNSLGSGNQISFPPVVYKQVRKFFELQRNSMDNMFYRMPYETYDEEIPNQFVLTEHLYADYIKNLYFELINSVNFTIYDKWKNNSSLLHHNQMMGIELKQFEYFNFKSYVKPNFGNFYQCRIDNQNIILHEILYERITQ